MEKKKKILEKIKKALPLILCVLLSAVMILGCVLVGRSYGAFNTLSAGAESSFNPEDYPSANLLDMEDFNLSFSGTYKNTYTGYKLTPSTTYTLSFDYTLYECDRNGAQVRMFSCLGWGSSPTAFSANYSGTYKPYPTIDNVVYGTTYRRTITFTTTATTTQYLAMRLVFVEGASATINVDIENIQLNVGSTAYPYVPSHDGLYEDGYEDGKADGMEYGKYGIWAGVRVGCSAVLNGSATVLTNAPVGLEINGINLTPLYTKLKAYSTCTNVQICFYFDTPVLLEHLNIRGFGKSTLFAPTSTTTYNAFLQRADLTNYETLARFTYVEDGDFYGLELQGVTKDMTILELGPMAVSSISLLNGCVFTSGEGAGYSAGYEAGINDGGAYDEGYEDGKSDGFKSGFSAGLKKGESDDPWDLGAFIFAIVDAPFKVIREALNFEILGYDVSSVVLFVITAFIVVFVVKKIKGG